MDTTIPDLQALAARVETLEKRSRWLKRASLAVLVLGTALAVMGQARPSSTSIRAGEFVVVDAEGHSRATLGMELGSPMLILYDKSYRQRAILFVDGVGQPALEFRDAAENSAISLVAGDGGRPGLWLSPGASKSLSLQESVKQKGGIGLYLNKEGPALQIEDTNGFSTVAGSFKLLTPRAGETHHTSAASLLLFDRDGKVLGLRRDSDSPISHKPTSAASCGEGEKPRLRARAGFTTPSSGHPTLRKPERR